MRDSAKAIVFLSLGTAMWGSTFLVIKTLLGAMSPGVLLCLRFGVSASVLLAAALVSRPSGQEPRPLPFRRLLRPSILIGLSLLGGYAFQTAGLQYTGPGKSAFITSLYVAFTPFAAWPINGRKPLPVHFLSVCTALLGVYLLSDPSGPLNLGDALTALSAVFWALEIALIDRLFVKGSQLRISAMMLAVVALGSAPLIPLLGGAWFSPGLAPALAMLYLAIPATSMLMFWQLKWQPSLGGSLSSLIYIGEAVVAAAGGAAFFGERFALTGWIGSALVIASILIAFRTERRSC